ncbi:MAG: hypothetical protein K6G31_05200 [Paludibacteraceae bacterium]|nr:hypothetical protein [Paludibacteraceae bacterium]
MKKALSITPGGIVRLHPATVSQPGHCDALLNLRPQGGGWRSVGTKSVCYGPLAEGGVLLQAAVHQLPGHPCLVAVRRVQGGGLQVAAAPLEASAPVVWQVLYTFAAGTADADGLAVHIAFIGNYCCFSVPQLHIFRFNGAAYVKEDGAADSAPTLAYTVQGRYTPAGSLLSFAVPVRGENLEGCYYREVAADQYSALQLAGTGTDAVSLNQGSVNTPTQWGNLVFGEAEKQALLDAMAGQYEAMQQSSDYYREGYVLVCSAWQLADGSYTCPSEPVLLHLGCEQVAADFQQQSMAFNPTADIDVYFNRDKISFKVFAASDISSSAYSAAVFSCYVRRQWMQQLTFQKPSAPVAGAGVFQKAVFFVSPPVSMYRLAKAEFDYLHTIHHYGIDATTKGLVPGGVGVDSYFRLALKHAATHREGLTEYLPSAAEVAGWLLYKAVEFDLTDPAEADTKRVDFSTLTSNDVLGAELAGHLSVSCGGLLAYNQRLHVWNCTSTFKGMPVSSVSLADVPAGFIYRYAESAVNAYITQRRVVPGVSSAAFVRAVGQLDGGAPSQVVAQFRITHGGDYLYHYRTLSYRQVFTNAGGNLWQAYPRFLSFPDNRCDQCVLYYQAVGGGWRSQAFPMRSSAGFNFSFALHLSASDTLNTDYAAYLPLRGGTPVSEADVELLLQADGRTFAQPVTLSGSTAEAGLSQPDLLMVSAPANPYVFPPGLAFHFGSPVTSAGVATREISSAQTGQYPLCVFTEGGIWSMELGTAAFYSRQVPISAEVSTGRRVLPTPFGIVFLTRAGVKLLQGRGVSLLGGEACGGVASAVWTCQAMASVVSGVGGQLSAAARLSDQHTAYPDGIAAWLAADVAMGYDAARHELLLSGASASLPLTYVYNFGTRQWYTFSDVFYSFSGNVAVKAEGQSAALCRLSDEAFPVVSGTACRPVALVSRPFAPLTLGYQHLDRLVVQGELSGGADTYAGLYVFASNNLTDWRMVSAVQWRHPLSPQARLPRSKRSWRFYAFAFFADVPASFSLSHLTLLGAETE